MSVQQLKEFKKMERDNAELRKQMQDQKQKQNADKLVATWMNQAEEAKRMYPSLDLNEEAKNPQFLRLLNSGVDVGTAYTVIHKDEIIPAAMQYTAKTVEQKLTNKVIAGGARPTENGTSSQSAAIVKNDVSSLTKADRAEIAEKGYSLTPGAYVGVAPVEDDGVDFAARMAEIHSELLTLQAESNELMDTISKNMKEMGL